MDRGQVLRENGIRPFVTFPRAKRKDETDTVSVPCPFRQIFCARIATFDMLWEAPCSSPMWTHIARRSFPWNDRHFSKDIRHMTASSRSLKRNGIVVSYNIPIIAEKTVFVNIQTQLFFAILCLTAKKAPNRTAMCSIRGLFVAEMEECRSCTQHPVLLQIAISAASFDGDVGPLVVPSPRTVRHRAMAFLSALSSPHPLCASRQKQSIEPLRGSHRRNSQEPHRSSPSPKDRCRFRSDWRLWALL